MVTSTKLLILSLALYWLFPAGKSEAILFSKSKSNAEAGPSPSLDKQTVSANRRREIIARILRAFANGKNGRRFRAMRQEITIYAGDYSAGATPLPVQTTMAQQFPSSSVIEVKAGTTVTFTIMNGQDAWRITETPVGAKRQISKLSSKFNTAQTSALKYSLFALLWKLNTPTEKHSLEFHEEKDFVVISIPGEGYKYDYYFGTSDWLCVKYAVNGNPGMGTLLYQDYKDAGGMLLPYTIKTVDEKGKVTHTSKTTRYVLNEEFKASFFSPTGVTSLRSSSPR